MNIRSLTRQPVLTLAFHEREVRWTLGQRGRIKSAGAVPLPSGLMADGVIVDPMQAGFLLREAPDFPGRRRMQVVIALPAQRSVFRQIDVPSLESRQLDEFIAREIRHEMPMLADNAYVSWSVAGEHEGTLAVFVVGAARDVLESHVEAVRSAGLQPMSADLRIIAAARAMGMPDSIVANVEEEDVEIGIFRGGLPAIVRHVAMVASVEQPAWADQLAEELARTAKFYRDSHRGDVLDGIPISFVGAAAQHAILSDRIGPATGLGLSLPQLRIAIAPEEQTARFAANVGLALKELAA